MFWTIAIVLLVVLVVAAIVVVVLKKTKMKRQLQDSLRQRVIEYQSRLVDYQQRLSMVDAVASDYINSLKAETSKIIMRLQNDTIGHHQRIKELQTLVCSNDLKKIEEAIQRVDQIMAEVTGLSSDGPRSWLPEAEAALQSVGQQIYLASKKAREVNLPRNRQRKPTYLMLSRAGITGISSVDEEDGNEQERNEEEQD